MFLLNLSLVSTCDHVTGMVRNIASQDLVKIDGQPVLIRPDPVGRTIVGCPNVGPSIKPCTTTLMVEDGYSTLLQIDGQPVCLDTVTGYTDGTPPGTVYYTVRWPGQDYVSSDS